MIHKLTRAPMGWNSYDYYDTGVTEARVLANAEYMAAHLKDAGWEYAVADIQWYARGAGSRRETYQYIPFGEVEMDGYGRLLPDPERFPSSAGGRGFGPLAERVHALGLKFGIHIMRGIPRAAAHRHLPILGTDVTADDVADPASVCGWNPDMYGVRDTPAGQAYYDSLARLYADWGVDFIKCDDICNTDNQSASHDRAFLGRHEMEMLSRAIERTGRDTVLSLSPGPALIERAWNYQKHAQMWRITDDFWDRWDHLLAMFCRCELWQDHVRAGSFPDCDMLPLGRIGRGFGQERQTRFTREEQRTMMTLWCVFGSPLMVGAELTMLDDWTLDLLTRRDILKLTHTDYVGRQHERTGEHAVWSCMNERTGETYLALFNLSDAERAVSCDLSRVDQFDGLPVFTWAREMWTGRETELRGRELSADIPAHGARLYELR